VHNERLFYQNADVLLRIVQMWQDIRLTYPHGHNQFLGDMFEGFLDQGVKQSEGQFLYSHADLQVYLKQFATRIAGQTTCSSTQSD
jgi:hypothetical protein